MKIDLNKIAVDSDGYVNHPDIPDNEFLCWQQAERLEFPNGEYLGIDDYWSKADA